jgi:hypothetical protein
MNFHYLNRVGSRTARPERPECEGLAPIQGKNTVVGATETRIIESVRLSATVSHNIRTRLASLASLSTFVTITSPLGGLSSNLTTHAQGLPPCVYNRVYVRLDSLQCDIQPYSRTRNRSHVRRLRIANTQLLARTRLVHSTYSVRYLIAYNT